MAIEKFYISLGKKILNMRGKRNFSQAMLGSRLDPQVTRASIANIEAGKQRVLAHTLVQLADALEVNLEDLLERSPRKEVVLPTIQNIETELKKSFSSEQVVELMSQLEAPKRKTKI